MQPCGQQIEGRHSCPILHPLHSLLPPSVASAGYGPSGPLMPSPQAKRARPPRASRTSWRPRLGPDTLGQSDKTCHRGLQLLFASRRLMAVQPQRLDWLKGVRGRREEGFNLIVEVTPPLLLLLLQLLSPSCSLVPCSRLGKRGCQ